MKSICLVALAALLAAVSNSVFADEPGPKPEQLFQQLDKNNDGTVDSDEIGEEHKDLFDRLVRRGDENSDGKLTKSEFLKGVKPSGRPDADSKGPRGRGPGDGFDPAAVFDHLDQNGDGKLTIDELPEQARERMAAMFDRLGKDEISKEDFQKIAGDRRGRFAAGNEPGDGDGPPRRFGRRGDGPPDGAAEGDSGPRRPRFGRGPGGPGPQGAEPGDGGPPRRGFGSPDGRGMRVPKLVELLDGDGDRKISKDELAKAAELFDKLDMNKDGSLDMSELLGPPTGDRGPQQGFQGRRGSGFRRGGPRDGGPPPGGPRGNSPRDAGPKNDAPEA